MAQFGGSYDGTVIIGTAIDQAPFDKGLKGMEASTQKFSNDISGIMKKGAAGLAGFFGAREIITMAGTWTDLESRVNLASRGLVDAGDILGRLTEIADRAYSPLEKTAEAFLSNATTLNSLGFSMAEQLDLADALTNALVTAGAKGDQFNMVMGSVSRAMAQGRLNGEELNMVLKYGGPIAEALADSMGVTVAQLRDLGSEGKLTSKVLADSLIANMDKWRKQAEEMPATIGDALTRMRNEMLRVTGEMNKDLGFEAMGVRAIDALKENIEPLSKVLPPLILGVTTLKVAHNDLFQSATKAAGGMTKATFATLAQTQAWSKEVSVLAAARSQFLGLNAAMAGSTAEIVRKTAAEVAQNKATLAQVNLAIAAQQATVARIKATRMDVATTIQLAAAESQLTKLQAIRAGVQNKLTASTNALAAAEGRLTVASRAMGLLGTGLKGIMGLLGGPWGLALTAATAGLYLFSTRQTEAEKTAERLEKKLEPLKDAYKKFGEASAKAADATGETSERMREELAKQAEYLKKAAEEFEAAADDELKAVEKLFMGIEKARTVVVGRGLLKTIPSELHDLTGPLADIQRQIKNVFEEFARTGDIELFETAMSNLKNKVNEIKDSLPAKDTAAADKMLAVFEKFTPVIENMKSATDAAKNSQDALNAAQGKQSTEKSEKQKAALKEIELILAKMSGDMAKVGEIESLDELEKFKKLLGEAGATEAEVLAGVAKIQAVTAEQFQKTDEWLKRFGDDLSGVQIIDLTQAISGVQSAEQAFDASMSAMIRQAEALKAALKEAMSAEGLDAGKLKELEDQYAEVSDRIQEIEEMKVEGIQAINIKFYADEKVRMQELVDGEFESADAKQKAWVKAAGEAIDIEIEKGRAIIAANVAAKDAIARAC